MRSIGGVFGEGERVDTYIRMCFIVLVVTYGFGGIVLFLGDCRLVGGFDVCDVFVCFRKEIIVI